MRMSPTPVRSLELRDLDLLLHGPHLDLAPEVAEPADHENVGLGVEEGLVPGPGAEVEDGLALEVEHGGLGGHEAVGDGEELAAGGPGVAVDRALLGQAHLGKWCIGQTGKLQGVPRHPEIWLSPRPFIKSGT